MQNLGDTGFGLSEAPGQLHIPLPAATRGGTTGGRNSPATPSAGNETKVTGSALGDILGTLPTEPSTLWPGLGLLKLPVQNQSLAQRGSAPRLGALIHRRSCCRFASRRLQMGLDAHQAFAAPSLCPSPGNATIWQGMWARTDTFSASPTT